MVAQRVIGGVNSWWNDKFVQRHESSRTNGQWWRWDDEDEHEYAKERKKSEKAKTCSRRSLPGCRGGPKAETSQHELSPWFLQFNMFSLTKRWSLWSQLLEPALCSHSSMTLMTKASPTLRSANVAQGASNLCSHTTFATRCNADNGEAIDQNHHHQKGPQQGAWGWGR